LRGGGGDEFGKRKSAVAWPGVLKTGKSNMAMCATQSSEAKSTALTPKRRPSTRREQTVIGLKFKRTNKPRGVEKKTKDKGGKWRTLPRETKRRRKKEERKKDNKALEHTQREATGPMDHLSDEKKKKGRKNPQKNVGRFPPNGPEKGIDYRGPGPTGNENLAWHRGGGGYLKSRANPGP